jgi:2-iminobutanoate/2-iminopropanoate deaminase
MLTVPMDIIATPAVPPTNSTYSQAVRHGGIVYVSGQTGVDPATNELTPGGQVAEYRQAIRNLEAILRSAGSSLDLVIRNTIYMTDVSQLADLNQVYAEFFRHRPAKTGVEVKALAMGASIEIESIAAVAQMSDPARDNDK